MDEQNNNLSSNFPSVQNTQPIGAYARPMETKSVDTATSPENQKKSKKLGKKTLLLGSIITILVIAVGVLSYLYYTTNNKSKDPLTIANEESEKIRSKVAEHILLSDEMPAIATIVDIGKLKTDNPEFYANAENGDKILVYSNRAILYDPESDRILNVAPIIKTSTETESASQTQDATTDTQPKVQGESTEEESPSN